MKGGDQGILWKYSSEETVVFVCLFVNADLDRWLSPAQHVSSAKGLHCTEIYYYWKFLCIMLHSSLSYPNKMSCKYFLQELKGAERSAVFLKSEFMAISATKCGQKLHGFVQQINLDIYKMPQPQRV